MKIALVYPRLFKQLHGLWSPLGIIILGTILKENGHDVILLDASFDHDLSRILGALDTFEPALVGISCSTDLMPNALEVLAHARQKGILTVVGGSHPTIMPLETLQHPDVDFVVMGEGEETLPELVRTLEESGNLSMVLGIGFKSNGKPTLNAQRPFLGNLDSIPFAKRELLDTFPRYAEGLALNVSAIRGCPFRCKFCQPTLFNLFGEKVRARSPENITKELALLYRSYQIRDFMFVDDLFTVNRRWLEEFRDALIAAGLAGRIRFSINSRVDLIDEEVIRILKSINTYYLLLGLESGSQEILDSCGKGTTVEQGINAVTLARKYGIRSHAYILLGLPGETRETLRATEELLETLRPDTVHVSIATPFVGTTLYEECLKNGLLAPNDYGNHDYYLSESSGLKPILGVDYGEMFAARKRILKKRRLRVMLASALETLKDTIRERSIRKIIFRAKIYREMRHYFG